jgi:hypothetical protein
MLPPFRAIMPLLAVVGIVWSSANGCGTRPPATVVDPAPLPPEAALDPVEAAKALQAQPRERSQRRP